MRTTLDIADDVLAAARELAKAGKTTAGQVISDLARQSLTAMPSERRSRRRGGFMLLPASSTVITAALVERLLDEGS